MGNFAVFDLTESGEKIGRKLFALLTRTQQKELERFISESKNSESDSVLSPCYPAFYGQEGDLYFCLEQRLVTIRGQVIPLTVKEFEIFALLIQNPKRVFTYEMLLDLVWHENYTYYSRKAINNHVSNLRKKIKIAPDLPDYVKSVYGVGYKFDI